MLQKKKEAKIIVNGFFIRIKKKKRVKLYKRNKMEIKWKFL